VADYSAVLLELIEVVSSARELSAQSDCVSGWQLLNRLRAAVFVDQMSRNCAAVGEVSPRVRELADMVALGIASAVDAECFSQSACVPTSNSTAGLSEARRGGGCDDSAQPSVDHTNEKAATAGGASTTRARLVCSVPEFCFFTLVFRHSNDVVVVKRSIELLEGALAGVHATHLFPHPVCALSVDVCSSWNKKIHCDHTSRHSS
jgi:hypothetical protein